ncbi:MAG: exo-beta-N-acetylmuramidase NamZ domain-containing protein [Pyrinomonadaceae bacterium]
MQRELCRARKEAQSEEVVYRRDAKTQRVFNRMYRMNMMVKANGRARFDQPILSWLSCTSCLILALLLCVSAVPTFSQGLPVAKPGSVGMNAAKLDQIDALVNADIAAKKLPGAVVLVGHKGKIVFRKAYGNRSLVPNVEPMTVDTIFDLASLTKPIATATSIMILVEQGKLRLNDTIGKFIPDIDDPEAKKVTIQQLLTHTSGYRPDFDLGEKWTGREGMLAALKKEKLRNPPGTKFVYSDIGFIVLGEIVSRLSNQDLWSFTDNRIFEQLYGSPYLNRTRDEWLKRVAPTEDVCGQQSYLGSTAATDCGRFKNILRGKVHDPTSFRMHGVAGHAGLFSTADDLARYCQMLLNGGTIEGQKVKVKSQKNPRSAIRDPQSRVLSAQTIARMTQPYVVSEDGMTRGLGWDISTQFSSNRGEFFPLGSFGHTGFTGTSVWIDPTSQTFVVFLSNRVHPDGKGDVTPLRAKVATVVASAIEDTPIEKWKEAEARYNAAVAAQIPRFVSSKQSAVSSQQTVSNQIVALLTPTGQLPLLDGMKPGVRTIVQNGIDILERDNFKPLEALKIGLVTNHTGRNLAGKSTIDILHESKKVNLVAIFAPEHGIRGELDTEKIDDTKDEKTGLPVYSLYKDGMRRPKPEQLADLDAIVYDIQDIGTRFYTYTATLKNVMEEAAKAKIPVFVLDRPNPINGLAVEGPLADEDKLSFIAAHTTPVRYGLTIGELGMMMNAERKIGADLRIIKMDGWSRSMWFDETGQTWVNPSPNMRSLTQATLYPGVGLLETTNLSVGRGTDTPFEVVGAPYIDGQKLAKYLNERNIIGVRFIPIRFKPNASVFKDEQLGGVNILITDRNALNSVRMGVEIAVSLRKLYPSEWQVERYGRLLVNGQILDAVKSGQTPENIEKLAQAKNLEFSRRRAPYLLYK